MFRIFPLLIVLFFFLSSHYLSLHWKQNLIDRVSAEYEDPGGGETGGPGTGDEPDTGGEVTDVGPDDYEGSWDENTSNNMQPEESHKSPEHEGERESTETPPGIPTNPTNHYDIFGRVFLDNNRDGVWDLGEPSLPDQLIRLRNCSLVELAEQYTRNADPNLGTYRFNEVPGGCYRVSHVRLPAGYVRTTPQAIIFSLIEPTRIRFGIAPASTSAPLSPPTVYGSASCSGGSSVTDIWWAAESSDEIIITRTDGGINGLRLGNIPNWTPWRDWTANTNSSQYSYLVYYHNPANMLDQSGRGLGLGWSPPGSVTINTGACGPTAPDPPIITSNTAGCNYSNPWSNLTWAGPTTGGPASGFELYRADVGLLGNGVFFGYTDSSGLANDTTYLYRVRTVGPGGASTFADAYIHTYGCQPSPFTVSQPQSTCNSTAPRMTISWTPSNYLNRYEVYRHRGGIDPANDWGTPIKSDFLATSYTDDDLAIVPEGAGVSYLVRAVNDAVQTAYIATPVGPAVTLDCHLPTLTFWVWRTGETAGPAPLTPIQVDSGKNISLSFSATHANYCDKVSNIPGIDPASDPNWAGRINGPNPQQLPGVISRRFSNPPTTTNATFSIQCRNLNLNPGIRTVNMTQSVSVTSNQPPAFIQTTGGDVHTQGKIQVPTLPTPAP